MSTRTVLAGLLLASVIAAGCVDDEAPTAENASPPGDDPTPRQGSGSEEPPGDTSEPPANENATGDAPAGQDGARLHEATYAAGSLQEEGGFEVADRFAQLRIGVEQRTPTGIEGDFRLVLTAPDGTVHEMAAPQSFWGGDGHCTWKVVAPSQIGTWTYALERRPHAEMRVLVIGSQGSGASGGSTGPCEA